MKKAMIIMMGAAILTSCTPKRPAATTTAVSTAPIITTTAGTRPELKLNSSSTSQPKSSNADMNSNNESEFRTKAVNTSADTSGDSETEEAQGNLTVKTPETPIYIPTENDNTENTEINGGETASLPETDITDVSDASIEDSVIQAGEAVIPLPAAIGAFEESGFSVDYDTAEYSEEDGMTLVDATWNGENVVLGYDKDTDEVSEVIITAPGVKIPGGFTAGDSLQAFRDAFGYWGGDIYKIGDAEYTVSGDDIIRKIVVRYVK